MYKQNSKVEFCRALNASMRVLKRNWFFKVRAIIVISTSARDLLLNRIQNNTMPYDGFFGNLIFANTAHYKCSAEIILNTLLFLPVLLT